MKSLKELEPSLKKWLEDPECFAALCRGYKYAKREHSAYWWWLFIASYFRYREGMSPEEARDAAFPYVSHGSGSSLHRDLMDRVASIKTTLGGAPDV